MFHEMFWTGLHKPHLHLCQLKLNCRGGSRGGGGCAPGARLTKIGKNMIFWRKIVIFHTKYKTIVTPPSAIGKHMIFWRKIVIFHTKYKTIFAPPSAIGKNKICWRKIVIFHTKYKNNFPPPSARRYFFKCAPPLTGNPGSAPELKLKFTWNVHEINLH